MISTAAQRIEIYRFCPRTRSKYRSFSLLFIARANAVIAYKANRQIASSIAPTTRLANRACTSRSAISIIAKTTASITKLMKTKIFIASDQGIALSIDLKRNILIEVHEANVMASETGNPTTTSRLLVASKPTLYAAESINSIESNDDATNSNTMRKHSPRPTSLRYMRTSNSKEDAQFHTYLLRSI